MFVPFTHQRKEEADLKRFHFDIPQLINEKTVVGCVRQGTVHVYNNYYVQDSIYGIVSANHAKVLVEGNYFYKVAVPTQLGVEGFSDSGDLKEVNNIFYECGTPQTTGVAFDPTSFYQYTVDNPATVPATTMAKAGAGSARAVGIINRSRAQWSSISPFVVSLQKDGYTLTGRTVSSAMVNGTSRANGIYMLRDNRSGVHTSNKTVWLK